MKIRINKNGIFLCLSLFCFLPILAQDGPVRDLHTLFNASHGVHPLSGDEVMELWGRVKANPAPYLPLLEELMDLDHFKAGTKMDRARADAAAWMLGKLNHPKATEILVRCFQELGGPIDLDALQAPLTDVQRDLIKLRRSIIEVMGESGDKSLARLCRNSFIHEDKATRVVMNRYLRRVDPTWEKPVK